MLVVTTDVTIAHAQKVAPGAVKKCALEVQYERINSIQLPSGTRNSYLGGNIVATCASQRMVLKSDSLEQYGDEGRFFFIGHVDYKEPRVKLKSDFLTFFQREDRLLAFLNVDAVLPNGSTLKGSSLEYFKPIPKVRPKQKGIAVGRPTLTIIDKDAQGKPQPVEVTLVSGPANAVYLLAYASKDAGALQRARGALQEAQASFRPITAADRAAAKPWAVKTVPYPRGGFAELARTSPLGTPEQQLRLINGYYGGGEPTPGQLVKVVGP